MNQMEFSIQMERLQQAFGTKNFDPVRTELIWKEVRPYREGWFIQVCDGFIGERLATNPPLPKDFLEKVSAQREILWRAQKVQHAKEAKEFFEQAYHTGDVRMIVQTIIDRMYGKVSDQDYANFLLLLKQTTESTQQKRYCKHCFNTGIALVSDGGSGIAHRCYCEYAESRRENFPRISRDAAESEWVSA